MHKLTMLMGFPRAGKSKWIEEHADNAIVVSSDWIRENILGSAYADSANAVVWSLVDSALRIVLSQNHDVILDGIHLTRSVRKFYIDIARKYKAKVVIVHVKTPMSLCLARNMCKDSHKLSEEKLLEMESILEIPQPDEYDEYIEAQNSDSKVG